MSISSLSKMSKALSLVTIAGIFSMLLVAGVFVGYSAGAHAASAAGGFSVGQLARSGTTTIVSTPQGPDKLQKPEIGTFPRANQGAGTFNNGRSGAPVASSSIAASNANLAVSFNGLNHREQRLANNGNQFSLEPPDQGLCVGNGFVMESINDALRVYDTAGNPLTGVTDLNTFYGYPPSINRTTGVFGQFVFDPTCYFDKPTQRWFQIADTLETDPKTGNFTGLNHIDIAVSQTADPTGKFTIYRLPVQDDGTQGTPNHHCSLGPCFGDFPHIGADANGIYITTNEYSLFGPEFHSAQIYAFSKQELAASASFVTFVHFATDGAVNGVSGFTIWPAISPESQYASALGGTEYFLSSDAAMEVGIGSSSDLIVWAITNTASLNTAKPAVNLSNSVLTINPYSIPPRSEQKSGPIPLGQCLDTPACATILLGSPDPFTEVEGPLDSNDTRMQQVIYAGGKLWGALDTTLTVGGVNKAGIEWFIVRPSVSPSGVAGQLVNQGYLGLTNTNLIYPAIGVTAGGKGVMAFTLVGKNNYPSAAYATIDVSGVGAIHVAAAGVGPQDGFTEYKAYSPTGNGVIRPRWGDYGAAVAVGNSIWIASEYIGQRCTLTKYEANPFGSCNGTRTALANWYTRISQVLV